MNDDLNYEWACASELRKQVENGKSWIDFSEEEKRLLEKHYSELTSFRFIKAGVNLPVYDKLIEYHKKLGDKGSLLETYSSKAQTYNIREGLKDNWGRLVVSLSSFDILALDAMVQEILGINPKLFVHNCTIITPKEKGAREWFRTVFNVGVDNSETITDLMKINNFDFRRIDGFTSQNEELVFGYRGSSRLWFGQKSFYVYRDRYMKKFLELADKASFEELWFVIDCFCDCGKYDEHRMVFKVNETFERSSPESAKSFFSYSDWLEYIRYHKTKQRIAKGLPLKWILPLDQKCMEEIILKALLKTNFEECLRVYNSRIVGSLKIQILERLSSFASTPEEHFTVASIAHKKGEQFSKLWKKHLILAAKSLKAKS